MQGRMSQPGINWTVIMVVFVLGVMISVGGTLWGTGNLPSFGNSAQENASPSLNQEQSAPLVIAPYQTRGSVPALDTANRPPAPASVSFAEFTQETQTLKILVSPQGVVWWSQRRSEPDLVVRRVLEQRWALELHLGEQGLSITPTTHYLRQIDSRISQGSKIGVYELRGWSPGRISTWNGSAWTVPIPQGERLGATITATFVNGKVTNLAFR